MSAIIVAAVQTAPVFGDVTGNVERALALVPDACDLAVLPELCTTGYQFVSRAEARSLAETVPDGPTCARLRAFAAARGTHVVAGLAERHGEQVFNSAVLFRPDGGWGLYRKVHLFWEEKMLFDAGDRGFPVFAAAGATVGLMICFDWIFPEAARSLALAGATLICHPSNLVLPHCPDAMITRCLENRVFAVTANRVGAENRPRASGSSASKRTQRGRPWYCSIPPRRTAASRRAMTCSPTGVRRCTAGRTAAQTRGGRPPGGARRRDHRRSPRDQSIFSNSTRRFRARPSSVALSPIGLSGP
jgi:predicted amidohydrolase